MALYKFDFMLCYVMFHYVSMDPYLHSVQCTFLYVDLSLLMLGFGATATGTGLFGQQQQQQSTGTSLFGNTAFGAAKPMFGAAATTASAPFGGLSTAGAGTTLFGQANQNKVSRVFCPRGK